MIEALSKESRYPEVSRHTKSVSDISGRSPDETNSIMLRFVSYCRFAKVLFTLVLVSAFGVSSAMATPPQHNRHQREQIERARAQANKQTALNGAANTSGGRSEEYPRAERPNYPGIDTDRVIYYDKETGEYYQIILEGLPGRESAVVHKNKPGGDFKEAPLDYQQPIDQEASFDVISFTKYERPLSYILDKARASKGPEVNETLKEYALNGILAPPESMGLQVGEPGSSSPVVTYDPKFKYQSPQDAISSPTNQDGQLFLVTYELDGGFPKAILKAGDKIPEEWKVTTVERVGQNTPTNFKPMNERQREIEIENSSTLKPYIPEDFETNIGDASKTMKSKYSRYQPLVVAIEYEYRDKEFAVHRENKELQITFLGGGDGYIYGRDINGRLVFIPDSNIKWVSPDPSIVTWNDKVGIKDESTGKLVNTRVTVVGPPIYGEVP